MYLFHYAVMWPILNFEYLKIFSNLNNQSLLQVKTGTNVKNRQIIAWFFYNFVQAVEQNPSPMHVISIYF